MCVNVSQIFHTLNMKYLQNIKHEYIYARHTSLHHIRTLCHSELGGTILCYARVQAHSFLLMLTKAHEDARSTAISLLHCITFSSFPIFSHLGQKLALSSMSHYGPYIHTMCSSMVDDYLTKDTITPAN